MKQKSLFRCAGCRHSSPRWFGRCPSCGEWNRAEEEAHAVSAGGAPALAQVQRLSARHGDTARISTSHPEIDRVLGGGLVRGSVVLLAGEPGIGKSTIVLQMMEGIARHGASSLLVSGEESLEQVGLRAHRLGLPLDELQAAEATLLSDVISTAELHDLDVLFVDSIQTLRNADLGSATGSVAQVSDCAAALVRFAKSSGTVVVMVGHVTKDGNVAGPKTLEHMVDAVLAFEGDRGGTARTLRAVKNRYGSCDEVGVFNMTSAGLQGVADPSATFLADRAPNAAGSVVFPCMEGSRPLLVEVQALVGPDTDAPHPRRVAIGFDARRLSMLLGVLVQHGGVPISKRDVFVSAASGMTLREPAADLAVAAAIASAATLGRLDVGSVVLGEVGLVGEVRRVPGMERRLVEAHRLGFTRALVPRGLATAPAGMTVTVIEHLRDALSELVEQARV